MRRKTPKSDRKPSDFRQKPPPKKRKVQKWSSITRSKLFVYYALKIFYWFFRDFSDPVLAVFSKNFTFLPKKRVFRTFFKKLWCRFSLKFVPDPCSSKMDFQKRRKITSFWGFFPSFFLQNFDFGPLMGIIFPNWTVFMFFDVFFHFFLHKFLAKTSILAGRIPSPFEEKPIFWGFLGCFWRVFSIKMYFYGELWESCSIFLLFFVFFVKFYMGLYSPFFRVFFIFRFAWESCSLFLKKRVKIKTRKNYRLLCAQNFPTFLFFNMQKNTRPVSPFTFSIFHFFFVKNHFFWSVF